MGKIYNISLNTNQLNSGTNNNAVYNIDWLDLLPDNKKFKLTFSFIATQNWGINNKFPLLISNLFGNTYKNAINGYQNSYLLGTLRRELAYGSYINYYSSINDNPPIYLETRPRDNNLNIKIIDNFGGDFNDNFTLGTTSGQLLQSSNILTVNVFYGGNIYIGAVIEIVGQPNRTVTRFLTGSGGLGSYYVDVSQTIATGTAFTSPIVSVPNPMAPYVLNLSFEELDE